MTSQCSAHTLSAVPSLFYIILHYITLHYTTAMFNPKIGLVRLHALLRMYTPTSPDTHMHARTHRPIIHAYYFCTAVMILERASMLLYRYIVPVVLF